MKKILCITGFGFAKDIWNPFIECMSPAKNESPQKHKPSEVLNQMVWLKTPGKYKPEKIPIETLDLIETSAPSLEALAKTFDKHLADETILIGWSLGATISIWLAYHYPKKIKRLICLVCNPKFIGDKNWPGMDPHAFKELMTKFTENPVKALKRFYHLCFTEKQKKLSKNSLPYASATPMNYQNFLPQLEILYTADVRDYLAKLAMPIDFYFGEYDRLVPVEVVNAIELLNPNISITKMKHHHVFIEAVAPYLKHLLSGDKKIIPQFSQKSNHLKKPLQINRRLDARLHGDDVEKFHLNPCNLKFDTESEKNSC